MSKKAHICLLSEHPMPNVCPLLDPELGANRVVYVASRKHESRLQWLEQVLQGHRIQVSKLLIDDAYGDVGEIQRVVETEVRRQREQGAEVLVNVTGGTRPMSIAAHMAAVNTDVSAFYVHDDTVAWLHATSEQSRASVDLQERLKLPEFLLTYGIKITESGAPKLPAGADQITKILLQNPEKYVRGIRSLNYHASKAEHSLRASLGESDRKFQPLQEILGLFEGKGLLSTSKNEIRFDGEPARFFCAGGWLEHATYRCIGDMSATLGSRLNDCQTSVEVEYLEAGKRSPKNEMDVVVLYNNGLHLIECKTRYFKNSASAELTESLYKLATLRRELGGINARAMLVSYLDVEPWHRERAELLDIELVAASQLRSLGPTVQQWLQS